MLNAIFILFLFVFHFILFFIFLFNILFLLFFLPEKEILRNVT